jgi:hypothetical protein
MLYVIQNGRQVWATKIVVGKPETPTPIMTAEMKSITINPTWNIPDTARSSEIRRSVAGDRAPARRLHREPVAKRLVPGFTNRKDVIALPKQPVECSAGFVNAQVD